LASQNDRFWALHWEGFATLDSLVSLCPVLHAETSLVRLFLCFLAAQSFIAAIVRNLRCDLVCERFPAELLCPPNSQSRSNRLNPRKRIAALVRQLRTYLLNAQALQDLSRSIFALAMSSSVTACLAFLSLGTQRPVTVRYDHGSCFVSFPRIQPPFPSSRHTRSQPSFSSRTISLVPCLSDATGLKCVPGPERRFTASPFT
jgi:hypothetical protein